MKRKDQPAASQPIIWTRADPTALAAFDPATKVCTMNCGPARDDPRSDKERKLLCDDCLPAAAPPTPPEMSRESRAMLLNVLWHHQGGNSPIGLPLRALLGIERFARLSDEQVSEAKWIDGLLSRAAAGMASGDGGRDAGQ